jgi:hypothetical protein
LPAVDPRIEVDGLGAIRLPLIPDTGAACLVKNRRLKTFPPCC